MTDTQALLSDLARVKAQFQLRAIVAAMGLQPGAENVNAAGHSHPRAAKPRPPALHGRGNHDTGE